jgi:hypothetical protein
MLHSLVQFLCGASACQKILYPLLGLPIIINEVGSNEDVPHYSIRCPYVGSQIHIASGVFKYPW